MISMPRSYAVIGAGAVGGFYGARLQKAGREVHFLLHSDYDYVRRHGITVESVEGDFHLRRVHAYRSAADMPACDVVCVCLKTTQNHILPEILPRVLSPDGVVITFQNGLGIEDDLAEIVGPDRVMGALCFICSVKIGPGRIRHLDYGAIRLGEYSPDSVPRGITTRMKQIGEDFRSAGISVEFAEDLLLARWQKLVWNIPFNGLCTILDADTSRVMKSRHAVELVQEIMREVAQAAAAHDRIITDEFIRTMIYNTRKMAPYSPSMKIDREKGRPMEIEAIYRRPLEAARKRNVPMPLTGFLTRELECLEEFVQAQASPGSEEDSLES
ncbi:MAG: putative 2-dehydropantoate 2-reductase [Verrucomicrobia bacterium]|nr:MAG: putative 2-dehydropantoate 2-reductase [Verrucomicrobiota bacterium]